MNHRACASYSRIRAPLLILDSWWSILMSRGSVVVAAYPPYFINIRRTGRLNALSVLSPVTHSREAELFRGFVTLRPRLPQAVWDLPCVFFDTHYSLRGHRLFRVPWNLRKTSRIFERNRRAAMEQFRIDYNCYF